MLASVIIMFVAIIAVVVITYAGRWKTYEKAGKPGWAAIIPIYNEFILIEIAGKPTWWIILYLVPLVNIIISIVVIIEVAAKFNKDAGFAVGLIFLPFIFYPILGFGDSTFNGIPGNYYVK